MGGQAPSSARTSASGTLTVTFLRLVRFSVTRTLSQVGSFAPAARRGRASSARTGGAGTAGVSACVFRAVTARLTTARSSSWGSVGPEATATPAATRPTPARITAAHPARPCRFIAVLLFDPDLDPFPRFFAHDVDDLRRPELHELLPEPLGVAIALLPQLALRLVGQALEHDLGQRHRHVHGDLPPSVLEDADLEH